MLAIVNSLLRVFNAWTLLVRDVDACADDAGKAVQRITWNIFRKLKRHIVESVALPLDYAAGPYLCAACIHAINHMILCRLQITLSIEAVHLFVNDLVFLILSKENLNVYPNVNSY